ncbi:PLC-like phosphodiesterases superfamily protein [Striga asiatica]|uniref:PLC-like phosphodiesterases superfamily protein n=1 Tax=Striga asiatica TaxID=4170 RepID=A0A5A7R3M8_STRAF|nr:PLC-like phosphodiesterases superfamily protein [Striga asiatica]
MFYAMEGLPFVPSISDAALVGLRFASRVPLKCYRISTSRMDMALNMFAISWDEWVGMDRLMKNTEENILKQQTLDKKAGVDKNSKSGRSTYTKPKSSADAKVDKDEAKNVGILIYRHHIAVAKGKKRKVDSAVESNPATEKLIKIQIPPTLKKQLVSDWELVTQQNKLVKLPRSPNVDDILTKYLEYRSKKDGMTTDAVGEILNGLRSYFDKALPSILLYKKERQQYQDAIQENISPSSVYGAEHLLRLFVKLPELLTYVKIEEETLLRLQQKLLDFLKYMDTLIFLLNIMWHIALMLDIENYSNLARFQYCSCKPTRTFSVSLHMMEAKLQKELARIGETCSGTSNSCNSGLTCASCPANGNTRPRCTRTQPIIPISRVNGLPFNRYTWLTTHNSFARSGSISGTGSTLLAPTNQEDSVANQLRNGVRGLMLDMYDFNDDVWLCHSFDGRCFNVTAFQPAINTLREIREFMETNPTEIITIFIEDYVRSPQGLTTLFNVSGLSRYMFPISHGNDGMIRGICRNRAESSSMNTRTRPLVLMNYFLTNPNISEACADNSADLVAMLDTCYASSGRRWPNFIAMKVVSSDDANRRTFHTHGNTVAFGFQLAATSTVSESIGQHEGPAVNLRSDGGGAFEAIDEANGHLTCGCNSIAYCRANATFGTCDVPTFSPPPPAELLSPTGRAQEPTNNSIICRTLHFHRVILAILTGLLIWLL